jgi:hypothetical protein
MQDRVGYGADLRRCGVGRYQSNDNHGALRTLQARGFKVGLGCTGIHGREHPIDIDDW